MGYLLAPLPSSFANSQITAGGWCLPNVNFIFILPELYSLYVQFDLHPEKPYLDGNIFPASASSVWDSQFGPVFQYRPNRRPRRRHLLFAYLALWAFLPGRRAWSEAIVYLL